MSKIQTYNGIGSFIAFSLLRNVRLGIGFKSQFDIHPLFENPKKPNS